MTGSGQVFFHLVTFVMLTDKQCKESASDLSVQPTRLLLSPGQTHELFIVASGTHKQLAKTPGMIGVLRVTSGEEILRKRYKR